MKKKYISVAILASIISQTSYAGDLLDVSKEKALKFHKFRMNNVTELYNKVIIEPSKDPKVLNSNSKPNKSIDKIIKKSDLLSVMHYDGNDIVIDSLSSNLGNNEKMYSFSMSKSYIGYLVGAASCDGYIDLKSPISSYIPETVGTLYENVTVEDMLDMKAGDSTIYGKKRVPEEYNGLLMAVDPSKRNTVIDVLNKKAKGIEPSKDAEFRYSDAVTDLLGKALENAYPGGLKQLYKDKLSDPAGNADEIFYLTDANGWPLSHAYLHSTRGDYMRMAILISDAWTSESCVGSYLRNEYETRVKTGNSTDRSYGGQFWFDNKHLDKKFAVMNGFGGQHTYIDTTVGTVTTMHAIRNNYKEKDVIKAIYK